MPGPAPMLGGPGSLPPGYGAPGPDMGYGAPGPATGPEPEIHVPVSEHTGPVVPQNRGSAQPGGTRQVHVPPATHQMPERATTSRHGPSTSAVQEQGQPVFSTGPVVEEMRGAVNITNRQEQHVMGETQQKTVDIPTVQEIVHVQEIPEVQNVNRNEDVVHTVQRTVEQVVRQYVDVPKI